MVRVAIAEDDFRVANIHEQFLSKIDGVYVVGKALNGKDTLHLLHNKEVDLLILDIFMPDMLGTDILKAVKQEHPNTDVIMITAVSEGSIVADSLRHGVMDYIIKPVTLDRFVRTIENYKEKVQLFKQEQVTQGMIDGYLGYSQNNALDNTPKGIDPLTLDKVKEILRKQSRGITAEEMGEKMGASRTTARRYLEYLISTGEGKAELEYGIVGRPERKYEIY
ncbi:response regulator transcription factor [Salirhabdus salicampi]|uniref:response regulator transcription factor n=1 Tax=Salirhabdus salicampi TaxID=476102 RepID=UPI0020C36F7F|nr:response regulator [Salirhabdus salicampi]MCP8616174.1 response regulator [Salirhabdus salicampi]